jgi:hypothetical protein
MWARPGMMRVFGRASPFVRTTFRKQFEMTFSHRLETVDQGTHSGTADAFPLLREQGECPYAQKRASSPCFAGTFPYRQQPSVILRVETTRNTVFLSTRQTRRNLSFVIAPPLNDRRPFRPRAIQGLLTTAEKSYDDII